ncbi:MAG: hypothetical protein P8J50_10650 [Acidimicrobiales bacterium]|nr:hypothetical protein [Acidimicrobiales bacterium]
MAGIAPRLTRALVAWVLVIGLTALTVHPERCGRPIDDELATSAQLAVDWFANNIDPNGDFVYRYDRDRAVDEGGYNDTRHAGVLWSLWQAERAGVEGAGEVAEAGFARVERLLKDTVVGPAMGTGSTLGTGTVGLLVAALDERRITTGLTDQDDLLVAFGRTLTAAVNADGSVSAGIHITNGPNDRRSPFFTGEVLWALARLHISFPDQGFDEPALRIRQYLIHHRDEVETPWPPVSDHWGAYAFETMDRWPTPPQMTDAAREWRRRQLGLFSLQVRYESQRVGGITHFTRGSIALAAGVGTLGEGLGNHLLHALDDGDLSEHLDVLVERADCAAHLLVTRQIDAIDARSDADPDRTLGAWFRLGDTQMDDQQHALSALLLLQQVRALLDTLEDSA